jgi:YebC/PmpR family DNA-binding regulatory protein
MAGHSKFSNIKHKKEKQDAQRGKIFTKLGRELAVAVKSGGADPNGNSRLKDIIAKCKAANMPNDTIDRSIKKAVGDLGAVNYEAVTYEGYGPNGVAVIVKALTDNKNRTAANVRNAFTKGGGNMGTAGCVSFSFVERGLILILKEAAEDNGFDEETLMLTALDAGALDFSASDEGYEIITEPDDFSAVRQALETAGTVMETAEITMLPQTYAQLTDAEDLKKMNKMLDLLDDDDDVQDVHHNWEE